MEMKASLNSSGLSTDSGSDPEEKEVSDEDDDDRNHKHRRRETQSQSVETDATESGYGRMNRKRHKPFENGIPSRQNESQCSDAWKGSNMPGLEKDINLRFDKRRHGSSRGHMDFNQRGRPTQATYGESGPGRGRGRDAMSWNQRDFRFNQLDAAAQIVQQGSINPNIFGGRGLPNVSNSRGVSWNAFGLVPGISNTGLESLHPLGFQTALRPTVNPTMNLGIPRPRCRDFEEQGFCLRGDMCPMEHGVNRIVVEDVQSLSQFNLPVPLQSGQLLGTPVNPVSLPAVPSHSTTLTSRSNYGKNSKINDVNLGMNGCAYSSSATGSGADLYDPDVPLWNEEGPESSISGLHSLKNDEPEPFITGVTCNRHHSGSNGNDDNEFQTRCTEVAAGSPNASCSMLGRTSGYKEGKSLQASNSGASENENRDDGIFMAGVNNVPRQKKRMASESGSRGHDSFIGSADGAHNARRASKAYRTLFVNGIPQKSNRKEILLAHFQKFGQIIDIYIPVNGEKAFVQFSKREEAEAALRSPDAVMGNRFIKLWWANRDNIVDDSINASGNQFLVSSNGVESSSQLQVSVSKAKENPSPAVAQKSNAISSDVSVPVSITGPKALPSVQKKLELEQLKELLRKKQELLEQKRNDFRRQLDKYEKQAGGSKPVEAAADLSGKRQKTGTEVTRENLDTSISRVHGDDFRDGKKQDINLTSSSPKEDAGVVQVETVNLKHPPRPTAAAKTPLQNRYKLDNRPTSFKILSSLPSDLGNVDALTEYFSSFGEVCSVELENAEPSEGDGSARVNFVSRHSAEKAFLTGKCWKGSTMHFVWITPRNDNALPMNIVSHSTEILAPSTFSEPSAWKDGEDETSDSTIIKSIESDVISQFQPPLTSAESCDPESCSSVVAPELENAGDAS